MKELGNQTVRLINSLQYTTLEVLIKAIRLASNKGLVRGWFRLLRLLAQHLPEAQNMSVHVAEVGHLIVDLRESMCFPVVCRERMFGAEVNVLRKILRRGDVVYDIGANYGGLAVYSANLVGKEGLVVAFEPASTALRLLFNNASGRENIIVQSIALGEEEGSATFFIADKADMSSFTAPLSGIKVRCKETVEIKVLDKIVQKEKLPYPTLIKCDVEGAEMKVFTGAKEVLSRGPIVFFEYSETLASPHKYKFQDLVNLLQTHLPQGTQLYRVSENGAIHQSLEPREGISNNYLLVPPQYSERVMQCVTQTFN